MYKYTHQFFYVTISTGLGVWFWTLWLEYQNRVNKMRAIGPTINQYTFPAGLMSGLQKYTRAFWKESLPLFDQFKSPFFFFVTKRFTMINVNDPTLFNEICTRKQEFFPKAVKLYDALRIFGDNIVTTDGDIWKRHRRCASAAFSETNNRLVHETTISTLKAMFESWSSKKDMKGQMKVHVLADATQLTLAVISSAAFGMKIQVFDSTEHGSSAVSNSIDSSSVITDGVIRKNHSTKNPKFKLTFTRCMELICQNTLPRILLPKWAFYLPIFNLPEIGLAFNEFDGYLLEVVNNTMANLACAKKSQQQQQTSSTAVDASGDTEEGTAIMTTAAAVTNRRNQNLLSLLAQAGFQDRDSAATDVLDNDESAADYKLTEKEILGNAFVFMLAGHETSAHTLAFALNLLALHPQEQEKLYQDVQRVVGEKDATGTTSADTCTSTTGTTRNYKELTYTDIDKLTYCYAVMKETLRLFPPVVTIPKVAIADAEIESGGGRKVLVPKDTIVNLQVYALHRNPNCYPNPDDFCPSRWVNTSGRTEVSADGSGASDVKPTTFTATTAISAGNSDGSGGITENAGFAAFSLGTRSCIGRRFAHIEIVLTLAMIAQRYRISVPEGVSAESLLETKNLLTLFPANDSGLLFTER